MDLQPVARWMSDRQLGEGALHDVAELSGGTQNIMLRFTRSGRGYVLRRGPRHLRPSSNSVMLRETRVLAALADTDVPHPRLIAVCDAPAVLGDAVFYLMEPVDGFNAGEELPARHASDPTTQFAMGLSMADALAKLGAINHVTVGLADYGKPDGFLQRQVPRWLSELDSYYQYENYRGPNLPGLEDVSRWLTEHLPPSWTPGIMHGDYHAANVMFSRAGPEVAAIVDWEMSTIGDPLLDLGWLLATWRQSDGSSAFSHALTDLDGLASTEDLVTRYAAGSSRDLSHIGWYTVLACFKLGIVIEGTHARATSGHAQKDVGETLHDAAVWLFQRAQTLIASGT